MTDSDRSRPQMPLRCGAGVVQIATVTHLGARVLRAVGSGQALAVHAFVDESKGTSTARSSPPCNSRPRRRSTWSTSTYDPTRSRGSGSPTPLLGRWGQRRLAEQGELDRRKAARTGPLRAEPGRSSSGEGTGPTSGAIAPGNLCSRLPRSLRRQPSAPGPRTLMAYGFEGRPASGASAVGANARTVCVPLAQWGRVG